MRAWTAKLMPAHSPTAASVWALSADEERDVMAFDPWGERDATYRTLRSSFVVVRSAHQCAICFGPIATGERVWSKSEVDDGKAKTFRFCAECCWCIAHRYDENEDDPHFGFMRMEERWEIGSGRAREEQQSSAAVGQRGSHTD
jgi:hypothetical protein